MKKNEPRLLNKTLPKSTTGIQGLDEITGGGLPTGPPTLIVGSAGYGKTLLAIKFLVRGAKQYNEPGVFFKPQYLNPSHIIDLIYSSNLIEELSKNKARIRK